MKNDSEQLSDLFSKFDADTNAFIEKCVKTAFQNIHQSLVEYLSERINKEVLLKNRETKDSEAEWIQIESLSRLRSIVGGRFSNLKKKWEDAGFGLVAHRGERGRVDKLKQEGWVELSNWILKQGYEVRPKREGEDSLFSIRPLQNRSIE